MRKFIESKQTKGSGPYSAMVETDNLIFVTGQLPIDYLTGEVIVDHTENATRKVMENIKMLLREINHNLSDIVRTTIYYTNPSDEADILNVYKSFFIGTYPAYSLVGAAFLPKGAKVQIDAVVCKQTTHSRLL